MIDRGIRALARLSLVLLALNAIVGAFWLVQNYGVVPRYGDTVEYLARAQTLEVDQYRGIFYPVLLRAGFIASYFTNLPLHIIIYLIQICVSLFSIYFLVDTIFEFLYKSRERVLLVSVLAGFSPLVVHFSLSLMTDSLAASFTILFLTGLVRGCLRAQAEERWYVFLAFSTLAFCLMALTRVEKLYLGAIMFSGVLIANIGINRHNFAKHKINPGLLGVVFFMVSIASILTIKEQTTVYNNDRPPLSLENMAFNRIVWPRMSDVHPYFPRALKDKITLADARAFDSDANNVYPFLVEMLKDPDGQAQINSITLLTLRNFSGAVIRKTVFDFIKYTIPNVAFPLEITQVLPESFWTRWTVTRFAMQTPVLSGVYLAIGSIQFFVCILFLFVIFFRRYLNSKETGILYSVTKKMKHLPFFVITFSAAILLNSSMFTLSAGLDAHIRYALPTYTIYQTVIALLTVTEAFAVLGMRWENSKALAMD